MRWKKHLALLKSGHHRRKDFVEWFQQEGSDASKLSFRILEEGVEAQLNELEIKWFDLLGPRFYGKLPSAGEAWQHSETTKQKISAGVKRSRLDNPERIGGRTGPHSEETKQKIREGLLRHYGNVPPYTYAGKNANQICTECGSAFSNKNKKKFCSPECLKSGRAVLGRKLTQEDIEEIKKMAATMSTRQIAPVFGVSHVTIYKALKK